MPIFCRIYDELTFKHQRLEEDCMSKNYGYQLDLGNLTFQDEN